MILFIVHLKFVFSVFANIRKESSRAGIAYCILPSAKHPVSYLIF
jgi:hypothetical protein